MRAVFRDVVRKDGRCVGGVVFGGGIIADCPGSEEGGVVAGVEALEVLVAGVAGVVDAAEALATGALPGTESKFCEETAAVVGPGVLAPVGAKFASSCPFTLGFAAMLHVYRPRHPPTACPSEKT